MAVAAADSESADVTASVACCTWVLNVAFAVSSWERRSSDSFGAASEMVFVSSSIFCSEVLAVSTDDVDRGRFLSVAICDLMSAEASQA